jgi:hypothetical protein
VAFFVHPRQRLPVSWSIAAGHQAPENDWVEINMLRQGCAPQSVTLTDKPGE